MHPPCAPCQPGYTVVSRTVFIRHLNTTQRASTALCEPSLSECDPRYLNGERARKLISHLPPVPKHFFFLFSSFLLLITYPEGAELDLYNSRDFRFAARQPNPLTAHREEQQRCPRQENPAAYGSFDSNAEVREEILPRSHITGGRSILPA